MGGNNLDVKKGAWAKEEDGLLSKCMENHVEGKWHEVPHKAGLNRCRKSCRLSLFPNYQAPHAHRQYCTRSCPSLIENNLALKTLRSRNFIIRMYSFSHVNYVLKVALIAGRLPGRTSNDVKNYWNTRRRTNSLLKRTTKEKFQETIKPIVTRPQPRSFTKSSNCSSLKEPILDHTQLEENFSTPSQTSPSTGIGNDWWHSFLDDKYATETATGSGPGFDEELLTSFWVDDDMPQSARTTKD
ncbi:hypothetical protein Prudu_009470 [Prunus dulcis]|uniref:Uncharacterized protein n=1 Tax=Prunus dulcis TaxID=3755 RepID=A0A4Y1R6W0_PRUDU|nr:hypothetical protein Prudu_009470 [Prunus dulcis]